MANTVNAAWENLWPEGVPARLDVTLTAPLHTPYTMTETESAPGPVAVPLTAPHVPTGPLAPSVPPQSLAGSYLRDFYYRIWVVPDQLQLRNPRLGVDNPIHIWNAYPSTNSLVSISEPVIGVEWDQNLPSAFRPIEYREVNFSLLPNSPISFDELFLFTFTLGSASLGLQVNRASVILMIPDVPVEETWSWLTDVLVTDSGKEQRVGLRSTPRRKMQYSLMVADHEEYRTQYRRLFNDTNGRVVVPYWQYLSQLTEPAYAGTAVLKFDPRYTDLREGEYALIRSETASQLVVVESLGVDGCTIDASLDYSFPVGAIICPSTVSRLEDRSKISMGRVGYGKLDVVSYSLEPRGSLVRPGTTVALGTFDGYDVLDRRHLINEMAESAFHGNYVIQDNETGVADIKSGWTHPQIEGARQFLIQRYDSPDEMDYWRLFLSARDGQRVPFLMQTWRADLQMVSDTILEGAGSLRVVGTEYATDFFPHATFKRVALHTNAGIIYKTINDVALNEDGTTDLNLVVPMPAGVTRIDQISFLNLLRLGSDEVRLRHYQRHTFLDLVIRTTDG